MTMTDPTRIERRPWGTLPGGKTVAHVMLSRPGGISVGVSTLGATITGIWAPGRNDARANVVLGFDDLAGYLAPEYRASYPYFGATVGRVADRIRGAAFEIDGIPIRWSRMRARINCTAATGSIGQSGRTGSTATACASTS